MRLRIPEPPEGGFHGEARAAPTQFPHTRVHKFASNLLASLQIVVLLARSQRSTRLTTGVSLYGVQKPRGVDISPAEELPEW